MYTWRNKHPLSTGYTRHVLFDMTSNHLFKIKKTLEEDFPTGIWGLSWMGVFKLGHVNLYTYTCKIIYGKRIFFHTIFIADHALFLPDSSFKLGYIVIVIWDFEKEITLL